MTQYNPYTDPFNREYILTHAPYLSVISDEDWCNCCDSSMEVADEDDYPAEAWSKRWSVSPFLLIRADAERGIMVYKLVSITAVTKGSHTDQVGLYTHHDSIWTPAYFDNMKRIIEAARTRTLPF